VNTEHGHGVGKGFVIRRDEPSISKTAQILGGEKTKAPGLQVHRRVSPAVPPQWLGRHPQ
jgi:hypothetical protein